MGSHAEVVICGAGIAGIATAHRLAVHHGVRDVVLVDERPPLSLTSDKSTEAYRNWWPGPDDRMVAFMNRSIDLLEELAAESGDVFRLNRRGYLYVTADPARAAAFERSAGPGPDADLLRDPALIRDRFPYLSEHTCAVLHARRCGWFDSQQLGMYLLEQARAHGARLLPGRVVAVHTRGGRVERVDVDGAGSIATNHFVIAAGPLVKQVAALIGVELPVFSELHLKASFQDEFGVVPRDAPLLIWEDEQRLAWSDAERELLAGSPETRRLLETFPRGVHTRPDGGPDSRTLLILWAYHADPVPETFPIPQDPRFAEIVLRGLSTMIPGLRAYLDRLPRMFLDGGYYTKTRENRFLSCPLPVRGAYLIGALSGYGLMAACGAAELVAAHLTQSALPPYAEAFTLDRYSDPAYQRLLEAWGPTGQL